MSPRLSGHASDDGVEVGRRAKPYEVFIPGQREKRICRAQIRCTECLACGFVFSCRAPERRGVAIYYDEPCEFCRKVCLILRMFLLLPETPILPAQHFAQIHREMQAHNSWVVVDHDGSHHVRFDAIVLVFRRSFLFSPIGSLLSLAPLRAAGERLYGVIARNRGALGRWSAVALPYRRRPIAPSAASQIIVGALMLVVLVVNLVRGRPTV